MPVRALLVSLLMFGLSAPAFAEPTAVTVRVIARDAKFIGTAMGGVQVRLRNVASGMLLAEGVTEGGTGDTDRIMRAPGRGAVRAGDGAAAFSATLELAEPTLVQLEVAGPLGHPGSVLRAAQQQWIMPGKPITAGDGWTIELPGLVITPETQMSGHVASVRAKVELMCGCPITPGGLWDAADYEVEASAWQDGNRIASAPLAFVTAPGGYQGDLTLPAKGNYRLMLFARNVRTGNSGYADSVIIAD